MPEQPLRIGYLIQQYPPEVGAGPARAGEMVRRWVHAGADVTVLTAMPNRPQGRIHPEWRGRLFGEERQDGARILRAWLFARPGGGFATTLLNNLSFAATGGLLALRRAGGHDVLIASSPPWFPLAVGVALHRRWKVPLVLELRDLWPDYLVEMKTLRSRHLERTLLRLDLWLLRQAARIVTVTEPLRQVLIGKGLSPDRIEVISNGVDPAEYYPADVPAPDPALVRRPGEFLVGYLGNFGAGQGLDVVLDAAARLGSQTPNIRFVLAGDGTDYQRIQRRVAEMRLGNLSLLGALRKDDTRSFYNSCDACLVPLAPLPMLAHALPTKLFEIMACAKPVIASAMGSVADVLATSGGGVAAGPGRPDALADAISRVARLDGGARAAMGAAGARYVAEHFHRGRLAERYLTVLRSAAAEGRAG